VKLCGFEVGLDRPLFLIAGPCVVESRQLQVDAAGRLKEICARLKVPFIFKSSYDKANRSSGRSFRGLGMEQGLAVLAEVKKALGVPVLTDVHAEDEVKPAAAVVDVLQTPAFLCRQTDFIRAAASAGRPVNIKKGQFLSPQEMEFVVGKLRQGKAREIWQTERGTTFGYQNLVVDMRSFALMKALGYPAIFDATHSVQLPGAGGGKSSGKREFVSPLARAALGAGADGLFIETHPDPSQAVSDGPNMVPLAELPALIATCVAVWKAVR
jgi:2-dehydro-3-deoxyphosphooctonate aldolase (KDO 8-P synthase)